MVVVASATAIVFVKQVYFAAGLFADGGNLPLLLLGSSATLGVSILVSRVVRLEEGAVVEGWIKSLVIRPVYRLWGALA